MTRSVSLIGECDNRWSFNTILARPTNVPTNAPTNDTSSQAISGGPGGGHTGIVVVVVLVLVAAIAALALALMKRCKAGDFVGEFENVPDATPRSADVAS